MINIDMFGNYRKSTFQAYNHQFKRKLTFEIIQKINSTKELS